jgi:hypothetical protein
MSRGAASFFAFGYRFGIMEAGWTDLGQVGRICVRPAMGCGFLLEHAKPAMTEGF